MDVRVPKLKFATLLFLEVSKVSGMNHLQSEMVSDKIIFKMKIFHLPFQTFLLSFPMDKTLLTFEGPLNRKYINTVTLTKQ